MARSPSLLLLSILLLLSLSSLQSAVAQQTKTQKKDDSKPLSQNEKTSLLADLDSALQVAEAELGLINKGIVLYINVIILKIFAFSFLFISFLKK